MKNELLLISLFICHFLADYTHLSTAWMLDAKRLGKPLIPILGHAEVHGILMGIVLYFYFPPIPDFWFHMPIYNSNIWDLLVIFQIITHFLIDVWKGRMNGWFPSLQNQANKWHWVVFGFDQLLHAIVIIIMFHYAINYIPQ